MRGDWPEIAVLMTCHNRRETTINCLSALRRQAPETSFDLRLFLTDDGSTDGTSDAVRAAWPKATIVLGSGSLYWAAGMALAERAAARTGPDYLLWLNDDTVLVQDALARLLQVSADCPDAIIVGATVDPTTGDRTYGGQLRPGAHPQRLTPLPLSKEPQRAATFNGNVVLVPWDVRQRVGPIDGLFPHAYADNDYGLRATALGIPIFQAPGAVGTCARNAPRATVAEGPLSQWRRLQSPTGMPWRAQVRYLRRHSDWRWPGIFVGQQLSRVVGMRR